jgi:hypothetical protein
MLHWPRRWRGPLTPPPQATGRDRRPAATLHIHGMAPGSIAAIVGQLGR